MRILHVVPTYVPAWRYGGPIVSVHALCKALVRLGHEVEVYTTTVDGPGDLDVPIATPVDVDGVGVTYFRCNGPRRLYSASALRRRLAGEARRFDVLHAHACFLLPPTWAARAAEARGVPYVFSPRGMLVPELIERRSAWIKRAWIRFFDRRTVLRAAAIHVTSVLEAQDLQQVIPQASRFAFVANGVDAPAVRAAERSEGRPPHVLFLGRVNWKKNIDRLIRAMADVPGARLRIVGNDEEGLRPRLEAEARAAGLSDRIDWLGPLYGAAKMREWEEADVFVLPSLSENFGNTVLEAMAAGVPVICTEGVGAASLVREWGAGVVVPGDSFSLASAINGVLTDPVRAGRMGHAGKEAASLHTWDAKAAEMEAVYRRIVGLPVDGAEVAVGALGGGFEAG